MVLFVVLVLGPTNYVFLKYIYILNTCGFKSQF